MSLYRSEFSVYIARFINYRKASGPGMSQLMLILGVHIVKLRITVPVIQEH